ncbi:MAG: alpha/beta hydrolase, partial [Chloroflexi bacterium]|nr:alpha/beta hydrolase [Chloroflexota bacterium]
HDGDFVSLADGARMHYTVRGDKGEDIILIHGMLDSTRNWEKNQADLARTHRVWAVDLVGFGFSSRLTRAIYSLEYFADTLRQFMDAHKIARANIVGHSLGGAVALEMATRFPNRVRKLVLINPAVYLLNYLPALNWAARIPLMPRALVGFALTSRAMREFSYAHALGNRARFDSAYAEWRRQPTRVRGTTDAMIALVANWSRSDLPARVHQVAAPTLILIGEKDAVVPPRHGARLARAMKNAAIKIVPGAGHIAFEEAPTIVNREIREFLGA